MFAQDKMIEKSFSFYGLPCIFFDGCYHLYNYFTQKSATFSDLNSLSDINVLDSLKKTGVLGGINSVKRDNANELHLTFITTTDCNLACDYCYAESKRQKLYLSPKVASSIIDSLLGNHFNGHLFVQFFGGEPTLNMPAIEAIVNKIKQKTNDVFFYVTTNGIFDNNVLQYLIDENIRAYLSIDGIESDHNIHRKTIDGKGSYLIALNNLTRIIESGLACKVRSTITPANITNMISFAEEMFKLGVKLIHFTPMAKIGYANGKTPVIINEEFEDLFCHKLELVLDIAKQYNAQVITPISLALNRPPRPHCKVFKNDQKIIITPEGKRTLCYGIQSASNSFSKYFLFESFDPSNSIWDTKPIIKDTLCKAYEFNMQCYCAKCFANFTCGGGCFAQNLNSNQKLDVLDISFCSIQKKMVFMLLRRLLGC